MQPLKTYEYLALARKQVLDWVRPLRPDQYTRQFEMGLGSISRILTHTMICEWLYVQRIQARPVPPYKDWPIQDESPPPFAALDAAWKEQANQTRLALSSVADWTSDLEYKTTNDNSTLIITASRADVFTQLVLHEVHHRAQVLNMLRHLGVALKDIDYNALMYRRRPVGT